MDIENSMVVGAQDLYDGCGRAYDRSSSMDEAREYFTSTDDGLAELHEHLIDQEYFVILQHLVLAAKCATPDHKAADVVRGVNHALGAINAVSSAIEFLANKKVNGVHQ